MKEKAINIKGVSKKYQIGNPSSSSLREAISGALKNKSKSKDDFWALKDISFDAEKGDVIGIIGKNGAGKSTLLKILSKITQPTTGRIEIVGRVASLLEVGTGFHPELTGRENIYLNGTLLGMTRKEVAEKLDEIIEFSGVVKFIDTPVKHYSSGMYVRLAFSVAAHLEPEILIIDEVLAVGDAEFQKKCLGKMGEVAGEGRTVLFVSHNLSSVKQLCTKGVYLEAGRIKKTGSLKEVIAAYQSSSDSNVSYSNLECNKEIYLSKAEFIKNISEFYHDERIEIKFKIVINDISLINKDVRMLVRIMDEYGSVISSTEKLINFNIQNYHLTIPNYKLTVGSYNIYFIIYQPAVTKYDVVEHVLSFRILDNIPSFSHLESFDIGRSYIDFMWKDE